MSVRNSSTIFFLFFHFIDFIVHYTDNPTCVDTYFLYSMFFTLIRIAIFHSEVEGRKKCSRIYTATCGIVSISPDRRKGSQTSAMALPGKIYYLQAPDERDAVKNFPGYIKRRKSTNLFRTKLELVPERVLPWKPSNLTKLKQ